MPAEKHYFNEKPGIGETLSGEEHYFLEMLRGKETLSAEKNYSNEKSGNGETLSVEKHYLLEMLRGRENFFIGIPGA